MGSVGNIDLLGQTSLVVGDSLQYNVPEPCSLVFSPHQFLESLDRGSPLEEVR